MQMAEILNMEDLINYGNGFYKIIKWYLKYLYNKRKNFKKWQLELMVQLDPQMSHQVM
jgi:hypothetical protein